MKYQGHKTFQEHNEQNTPKDKIQMHCNKETFDFCFERKKGNDKGKEQIKFLEPKPENQKAHDI